MTGSQSISLAIPTRLDMRATTGQVISVQYDAVANAIVFVEQDWFADAFRLGGVPPKTRIRRRLTPGTVTRLRPRGKSAPLAPQAA